MRACENAMRVNAVLATDRPAYGNDVRLPPFPEGWYLVDTRARIQANKLLQKTWMGQEIVVFYGGSGSVCVADAYCPHMGSHLGPETGGKVRADRLVCPFHGFEYDSTGQCVATRSGPAVPRARLSTYETRELDGMVFAWWGHGGRPPQWQLPNAQPEDADWSPFAYRRLRLRAHPQETAENSVDIDHLRHVHGYTNVYQIGEVKIDGERLLSRFHFTRSRKFAGLFTIRHDLEASAYVHGLGYSFVQVHESTDGMDFRLWVLVTPVDGEWAEFLLASQVRRLRKPKRFAVGLRFLPVGLRTRLMNFFVIRGQKNDVIQDSIIWRRKQYRPRPALSPDDAKVGLYRRYCRQFYPQT